VRSLREEGKEKKSRSGNLKKRGKRGLVEVRGKKGGGLEKVLPRKGKKKKRSRCKERGGGKKEGFPQEGGKKGAPRNEKILGKGRREVEHAVWLRKKKRGPTEKKKKIGVPPAHPRKKIMSQNSEKKGKESCYLRGEKKGRNIGALLRF